MVEGRRPESILARARPQQSLLEPRSNSEEQQRLTPGAKRPDDACFCFRVLIELRGSEKRSRFRRVGPTIWYCVKEEQEVRKTKGDGQSVLHQD